MKPQRNFSWRRLVRRLCWLALFGFVLVNCAAFLFARKMLVFADTGFEKRGITLANAFGIFFHGIAKPTNYRSPADHGLAFTTVVLRAAGQPDLEAWHVPHPNPRATVVLLHGYSACKSQDVPRVPEFHKLGCEVWLLDFHGSGGSSGNTTSLGHHEAEDLARLVAGLNTRGTMRPLILHGVSMGGAAITRAIAELGVVADGVILVSTYNHMTDAVARRIRQTGVPDWPLAHLILFWGGVQRGMNPFALRPADYARKITCPALVLHGALDRVVDPEAPKQIYANLVGPRKLITFDREGHGVHLDHEAEKWRTEVSAWLDEVIAGASR